MKIEYNEFIGFYRNLYPEGYCQHLIKEFDKLQEDGVGYSRQQSEKSPKHFKNDHQIGVSLREHNIRDFQGKYVSEIFFEGLQQCYDDYCNNFSVLTQTPIRASVMKMQKTGPGGGYHIWHFEQGPNEQARRVLVYMLYLNNLSENAGGETEFLYQRLRIPPEENLMILWPASYTHAHRGNLVLKEEYKYIVTGWFYYD